SIECFAAVLVHAPKSRFAAIAETREFGRRLNERPTGTASLCCSLDETDGVRPAAPGAPAIASVASPRSRRFMATSTLATAAARLRSLSAPSRAATGKVVEDAPALSLLTISGTARSSGARRNALAMRAQA